MSSGLPLYASTHHDFLRCSHPTVHYHRLLRLCHHMREGTEMTITPAPMAFSCVLPMRASGQAFQSPHSSSRANLGAGANRRKGRSTSCSFYQFAKNISRMHNRVGSGLNTQLTISKVSRRRICSFLVKICAALISRSILRTNICVPLGLCHF